MYQCAPTGIRIKEVRNAHAGATNENEERVLIVNEGSVRWDSRG